MHAFVVFCYFQATCWKEGVCKSFLQFPISLYSRNPRLQLTNLKFQVRWIQNHSLPLPPSVSQKKIPPTLQVHPLPIWPCCVSSSRPSTGRCRQFIRTLLPRPFSVRGSHRRSCTRPSTSWTATGAPRTACTVTTATTSTEPNRTGTETTGCCRRCLTWSATTSNETSGRTGRVGKRSWMPCWKDQLKAPIYSQRGSFSFQKTFAALLLADILMSGSSLWQANPRRSFWPDFVLWFHLKYIRAFRLPSNIAMLFTWKNWIVKVLLVKQHFKLVLVLKLSKWCSATSKMQLVNLPS